MERWTVLSLSLILAYSALSSSALRLTIRRRVLPELMMFRVYLGTVALIATAGIFFRSMGTPRGYATFFWASDMAHDAALCLLGINLIATLMPRRFVVLWSIAFVTLLLLTYGNSLPSNNRDVLVCLGNAGDLAAALILCGMMFFPDIDWGWHRGMVTAGMVCTIAGNLIPGWEWSHGGSGIVLQYLTQAAPLGGMVIFLIAAMNGKKKAA